MVRKITKNQFLLFENNSIFKITKVFFTPWIKGIPYQVCKQVQIFVDIHIINHKN